MQRLEALYVWYAWTVALAIVFWGGELEWRWSWALGHAAVIVPAVLLSKAALSVRFVAACVLTPTAFSTLGVLLPPIVPEAVHWDVYFADLAVGGATVRDVVAANPWPWLVELAQICYALFYFLPIALGVALLLQRRVDDAMRVTELAVGALLLSYLGYLVFPAMPPYRFVPFEHELVGGPSFAALNTLLYELEPLREDCMPSGHTMLTLLVLWAAWRVDRRQLAWLVPVALPLLLATVMLRYHWWIDLLAGIAFAVLGAALFWRPAAAGDDLGTKKGAP